jgi:hypothetical protein
MGSFLEEKTKKMPPIKYIGTAPTGNFFKQSKHEYPFKIFFCGVPL